MLRSNGYQTAGIGKYHVGMAFDNGQGKPAKDFFFDDVDFTKPYWMAQHITALTHHYGVTGNTEDPLDTEPRILFAMIASPSAIAE